MRLVLRTRYANNINKNPYTYMDCVPWLSDYRVCQIIQHFSLYVLEYDNIATVPHKMVR